MIQKENRSVENAPNETKKSLFDTMISELPQAFKDEISKTDHYLKAMRPLKFRRVVDKKAKKITYVASDYGVSYMFKVDGNEFTHNFQWYIVYNGKPETWHRRADYMEEVLAEISNRDHKLAVRIFNGLKTCHGLDSCSGERCLARTPYTFENQKRLTCHGSVELSMSFEDLCNAREFFFYLNEVVKDKIAAGEPLPEKIILCHTKRSL